MRIFVEDISLPWKVPIICLRYGCFPHQYCNMHS